LQDGFKLDLHHGSFHSPTYLGAASAKSIFSALDVDFLVVLETIDSGRMPVVRYSQAALIADPN